MILGNSLNDNAIAVIKWKAFYCMKYWIGCFTPFTTILETFFKILNKLKGIWSEIFSF